MALLLSFSELTTPYARTQLGEFPLEVQHVTISDVYAKVLSVTGNKASIIASVGFIKDVKLAERIYTFTPDLEGPNFIKQAYQFLKTLPEFSDATDC